MSTLLKFLRMEIDLSFYSRYVYQNKCDVENRTFIYCICVMKLVESDSSDCMVSQQHEHLNTADNEEGPRISA
jgi:hypothetical protein